MVCARNSGVCLWEVMGEQFSRILWEINRPSVDLLSSNASAWIWFNVLGFPPDWFFDAYPLHHFHELQFNLCTFATSLLRTKASASIKDTHLTHTHTHTTTIQQLDPDAFVSGLRLTQLIFHDSIRVTLNSNKQRAQTLIDGHILLALFRWEC